MQKLPSITMGRILLAIFFLPLFYILLQAYLEVTATRQDYYPNVPVVKAWNERYERERHGAWDDTLVFIPVYGDMSMKKFSARKIERQRRRSAYIKATGGK
jgi:hypothetical protein